MSSHLQSILDRLYSLHAFGIKPGLERTEELSASLGNPHLRYPTIHVAGTNGKGTTCSVLASCLQEAGYTVGLYTSPHIQRFNERIKVNGIQITDEELVELIPPLLTKTKEIGSTFFETTTILAFEYFARKNVDIAIIETGLGGRLDSTNIITPLVSVITSIDFDHQEYLGNTLEKIAFEKAGIIKPNIPVVVAEPREELRKVFTDKANNEHSQCHYFDVDCVISSVNLTPLLQSNFTLTIGESKYNNLEFALSGNHLIRNASTAIRTLHCIQNTFPISEQHIRNGLKNLQKNTGLASRIQLIQQEPIVITDVAHNVVGLEQCFMTIKNCGYNLKDFTVLFGVMADKNYDEMVEVISKNVDNIVVSSPKFERALSVDNLYSSALNYTFQSVRKATTIEDALQTLLNEQKPFITLGSFHVAEEVYNFFDKQHKQI
jgi:dihydrofolate synthase/folylpolyglutamate synthase